MLQGAGVATSLVVWATLTAVLTSALAFSTPMPTAGCGVGQIGTAYTKRGTAVVSSRASFVVAGWAVDRAGARVPLRARIRLAREGTPEVVELPLRTWHERLDVAMAFRESAYLIAGFRVVVPAGALSVGRWRLSIVYARAGVALSCDVESVVDVRARL